MRRWPSSSTITSPHESADSGHSRKESRHEWSPQHLLVHGAWADGSCWSEVIELLQMGPPAWTSLLTWYLVAQNDEALPPDAERQFAARMGATAVEIPASHVAMVSHPTEVAQLIEQAAQSVGAATAAGFTGRS